MPSCSAVDRSQDSRCPTVPHRMSIDEILSTYIFTKKTDWRQFNHIIL